MTRLNNEQEVLHDLRTVGWLDDSATVTDTTSSLSKGDTSVPITSGTGIADGDLVRIADQGNQSEVMEVASGGGTTTLTPTLPIAFDHASGVSVTKLTLVDVGDTSDEGVTRETDQEENELIAGTQRPVFLVIPGRVTEAFTMSLLGYNAENLALTMGVDEQDTDRVVAAAGVQLVQDDYGTWLSKPWKFEGFLENADTVTWVVYNAKVIPTGSENWRTGEAAPLPTRIRSTGARCVLFS